MNTSNEYKTIAQIEKETETVRYYREFDYARAMAMTKFLRELETKHGDQFHILVASPHLFVNRNDTENNIKTFGIGLWVRWSIEKTEYYMQMNENPFFDAYIARSWKNDTNSKIHEYGSHMNDMLYDNVNWNSSPETIEQLTKNFHKTLNIVNNRKIKTYTQEIPAYEQNKKQTIYKQ